MKSIISILLFLILIQANSQNYIETIDNLDPWSGQTKYDYQLLSRFDKYCRTNNLIPNSLGMIDNQGDNSWSYTKAVDINNDGLQDIIFSGPSGGEGSIVYFFIQTNNGFKQVFKDIQGIKKVTWENDVLNEVYISNWGCCAEIYLINSVYKVKYDDQNNPTFTKIFQTIEVDDELIKPKNYFSQPIEFTVNYDGYKLRLAPEIDDTTRFQWLDITGNTIATLKNGTKGTALSSSIDDTGRVWWYSSFKLDENVQNSILQTHDNFPTQIIGWISSRYVSEN